MARTRKTGFGIKSPSQTCQDKKCPFHGKLKVRGKQFTGKIVSDKMPHSVVVEWLGWKYLPKYERYKKIRTRVAAHKSPCINAKKGDLVKLAECRPLSKTKNFVVLSVMGEEKRHALEQEALDEGKHKEKAKHKESEKMESGKVAGKVAGEEK